MAIWKEATTWEECAEHVRAGGTVELHTGRLKWAIDSKWAIDEAGPMEFMRRHATPGQSGWAPRRLVPTEAAVVSDLLTLLHALTDRKENTR